MYICNIVTIAYIYMREIDKANVTCYCLGNLGYGHMENFYIVFAIIL